MLFRHSDTVWLEADRPAFRGELNHGDRTPTKLLTAEEFMAADLGEGTFELVRGEIVEMPAADAGTRTCLCEYVAFVLENYGRQSGHGYALSNDSAVVTERNPDTVRGPDVCFYSHARWPRAQVGNNLPPVPPDSPSKLSLPGIASAMIMKKVSEYLGAGVSLVWVVYPNNSRLSFIGLMRTNR